MSNKESHYDLVIINGTVVNGSGLARRRGDVGIRDGNIVKVGLLEQGYTADEIIDASDRVVAPGIIDLHTHYDPQLTFDPYATCSCYHGVTTVLAGNCGFSIAPTRVDQRDYIMAMFAKVEGMDPAALEQGVNWNFESFPEYLQSLEGNLGVNMGCYVGHSSLRRFVMGADGSQREATADEIAQMETLVAEAMEAGAAGFSSSYAPTQVDGDNHPIPSRFAHYDELHALVDAAGRSGKGSIAFLPASVIGGLQPDDEDLMIKLGASSGLPIIMQGLGGRDKTDTPGVGWADAKNFLERAGDSGAAILNLLRNHPFDRPIDLADNCPLYAGVPSWAEFMVLENDQKLLRLADPEYRNTMRDAVENPNRDSKNGSTLPPPHWDVTFVDEVSQQKNEKYLRRSIKDIAEELGKTPADTLLDLALEEELQVKFRWENKSKKWDRAVRESMKHPAMLMGVSDGGAHLDRDDGADWSSYFFYYWVREQKMWTLEEAVRQVTHVPAMVAGFADRGLLIPGMAADIMIFDPDTIMPGTKRRVASMPGNAERFEAMPRGIDATIVNGVPIVRNGELQDALPGKVVSPA